jgi:hypothetical protein
VIDAVLELVRPGTTGLELVRRATAVAGGRRPWPEPFYLIHGIGTDPAEMPLIGTDLGEAFDESVCWRSALLVLEPAIWDDGHAVPRRGDRGGHADRLHAAAIRALRGGRVSGLGIAGQYGGRVDFDACAASTRGWSPRCGWQARRASGREANARYAAGARHLDHGRAPVRGCVLLASGELH